MVIIGARLASVIGHDRGGPLLWWIVKGFQISNKILLVLRFRKLALLYPSKIQRHKYEIINIPLWIPCSRDKGPSSSSLIVTSALALYLRCFSSGWTPTRNLRSNTCLQKISEFLLKKHVPSQYCLLWFISGWQQLFRPFNIKTSFYALLRVSWLYLASDLIYLWSDKISLILFCIIPIN